jgi:hypothetical protein
VVGAGIDRIALCGVASRPFLDGETLATVFDFKGSAEYRQAMSEVVKRRALSEAKGG